MADLTPPERRILISRMHPHEREQMDALALQELWYVFSYYRMCSLTIECVLLLALQELWYLKTGSKDW